MLTTKVKSVSILLIKDTGSTALFSESYKMTRNRKLNRREFIMAAGSGLTIASCGTSNIPALSSIYSAAELAVGSGKDITLSRADISKLPFASCYARINDSARAFLVLSKIQNDNLHWISADRNIIVSTHGRVTKTVGLSSDLLNTTFLRSSTDIREFYLSGEAKTEKSTNRLVDISPGNLYGMPIDSVLSRGRQETIQIAELMFDTHTIIEDCEAADLDWKFRNIYWVDSQTGFVWQSVQHITPTLGTVTMNILKPARIA